MLRARQAPETRMTASGIFGSGRVFAIMTAISPDASIGMSRSHPPMYAAFVSRSACVHSSKAV